MIFDVYARTYYNNYENQKNYFDEVIWETILAGKYLPRVTILLLGNE